MVLQFSPCEVSLAACLEEGTGEGLVGTHLQVGRQLAAREAGQLTHVRTHHWEVLAGLKVGGQTVWRGKEIDLHESNICTTREFLSVFDGQEAFAQYLSMYTRTILVTLCP